MIQLKNHSVEVREAHQRYNEGDYIFLKYLEGMDQSAVVAFSNQDGTMSVLLTLADEHGRLIPTGIDTVNTMNMDDGMAWVDKVSAAYGS